MLPVSLHFNSLAPLVPRMTPTAFPLDKNLLSTRYGGSVAGNTKRHSDG